MASVDATQAQKLAAFDAAAEDFFGFSVALDGGTALIGAIAFFDGDNGLESGSAYIFQDTSGAGDWSSFTETKLIAFDGASGDRFGIPVALDGGTALIGAVFDNDACNPPDAPCDSGSAYVGCFHLTPEQIGLIIDDVGDLVTASVLKGNSLISKLEAAVDQLNKGHLKPAIAKLEDFIQSVENLINKETLTAAQGQPLIDAALDTMCR